MNFNRIHLYIILFLLNITFLKANNIDSLKQAMKTANNIEKTKILKQLFEKTKYTDLASALNFAKQTVNLTLKTKDTLNLGIAYRSVGNIYSFKGYTELAMQNYQKSLTEFKKINNELEIAKTTNNIANIYRKLNKYDLALSNYNKSFSVIKRLGKTKYYSSFYLNISALYTRLNKVDSAIILLRKVKLLIIGEKLSNITIPAKYNSGLADCFFQKNILDSSIYYYKKAIKLAEKIKANYFLETAYYSIADVYLESNNYMLANKYYLKALKISSNSGNLATKSKVYKGLYKLNLKQKNYKISSKYMNKYIGIKDSLYEKQTSTRIEELRLLYDIESKNKEIALLEKNTKISLLRNENENAKTKQFLFIVLIIITIIVSISIIIAIQTRRKLLKYKLEKNELKNSYLQKEIKFKTTQLTDFALYIIKRNDFLRDINIQLKKLKKKSASEILPDIRNIEELIKYSINISKDRKEFNSQVELVNQKFYEKIKRKYPELTKNERNIAILLKLNLTSKEIASILNVSSKSIDNYRYNIRKKLELTPKEDLNTILNNI